jgi:23S rRNA (cytosine1962-C5)-methyltransferase
MSATVVVNQRGAQRAERGHPWIYQSDVVEIRARGGDVVEVWAPRGRKLGEALYSDRSQIALRLLTRGEERFGIERLAGRLDAAITFRDRLGIDATAYRLVHAEADELPSLVVDRYADVLVVQALSQGMDRLLDDVVRILEERLRPAGILARHDVHARALEGLSETIEVLSGTVPATVAVRDRDLEYEVDLHHGQKTGLFLDQRENRWAAAAYASGRALDCFSYDGGFSLALARRSSEVLAVESSEQATARLAANAIRNGLANVRTVAGNVFDALREMERRGERFGTVVLDPPAFAKTRAALSRALGAYKEINLRALKILEPGGMLVTCSCSFHVSESTFLEVVQAAARDARAVLSLVEKRTQARDHPVLLGVPETYYLKCLLLRKL